jgi:hypothetical protein
MTAATAAQIAVAICHSVYCHVGQSNPNSARAQTNAILSQETQQDSDNTRRFAISSLQHVDTQPVFVFPGTVYERAPSAEDVTVSDVSTTRILSAVRLPSTDSSTVSDSSLTRILSATRVPSTDSTTVADSSLTGIPTKVRAPSADSITVSDSSLTRLLSAARAPSADTTSISDASLNRMLSALRVPSSENTGLSESIDSLKTLAGVNYERSPSADTITVADGSLTRLLSAVRLPSTETTTVSDSSLTRLLQLFRLPSADTVALSESVDGILITPGQFNRSPSAENVTVTEASLTRTLQSFRAPSADTTSVNEQLTRLLSAFRSPSSDSTTVTDVSVTRIRSLSRSTAADTSNVIESALTRLLSAFRSPTPDTTGVSEVQALISFTRSIQETLVITEPVLERIVYAVRTVSDSVDVAEAVFYQALHKFVFDSVIVADQLFSERQQLSGPTTYATPDEVRPLLGNLGDQRTDTQIALAVDAAYDEINTKTNRIPPSDWKDTDHNFGVVKKLTRLIAVREMAIGIKDFDTEDVEKQIAQQWEILLSGASSSGSQDLIVVSEPTTYANSPTGLIWSTRYKNLRKGSSTGENDIVFD